MAATVTVTESHEGRWTQVVRAGDHIFRVDEPKAAGGGDRGPDPYALLLAALGTCTSITLRMYADRKGWPLTHVEVLLRHGQMHAADCAGCESDTGTVDVIVSDIVIDGDLDEDQKRRLLQVAERCPLHRTLTGEIKVVSGLVGRPAPVSGGEE